MDSTVYSIALIGNPSSAIGYMLMVGGRGHLELKSAADRTLV